MRVSGFYALIFCSLFSALVSESLARDPLALPTDEFETTLRSALRKVIPAGQADPLDRLFGALKDDPVNVSEVNQVLEAHRVLTLRDFVLELKGRIDQTRKSLSRAEEDILRLQRLRHMDEEEQRQQMSSALVEVESYRQEATGKKLFPKEAAAILYFYRWWNKSENSLFSSDLYRYASTSLARTLAEVTRWTAMDLREHGHNLRQVTFDPAKRKRWREAAEAFWDLNLKFEFLQIWAQLVNQSAGHARYRHLEGFEVRFLYELRRFALDKDVFRGRELLLGYLINYASSNKIAGLLQPRADLLRSGKEASLAEIILLLFEMRNKEEWERLFRDGQVPRRFRSTNLKQWRRVLMTFQTASQTFNREDCVQTVSNSF